MTSVLDDSSNTGCTFTVVHSGRESRRGRNRPKAVTSLEQDCAEPESVAAAAAASETGEQSISKIFFEF